MKSKERDDVDEVTNKIVKYIKERLKYESLQVYHCAHGMKQIAGSKDKDLSEDYVEHRHQSPEGEQKEKA